MFIQTQKVYEPIFINGSPNFVEVEAFRYDEETSAEDFNKTGIKVTKVISLGKKLINLNLVGLMQEETIQSFKQTYVTRTSHRDPYGGMTKYSWLSDKKKKTRKLDKPIKVYKISKAHSSLSIGVTYIKFINNK